MRWTSALDWPVSTRPRELRVLSSSRAASSRVIPARSRISRSRRASRRRRNVGLVCATPVTSRAQMITDDRSREGLSGIPTPHKGISSTEVSGMRSGRHERAAVTTDWAAAIKAGSWPAAAAKATRSA